MDLEPAMEKGVLIVDFSAELTSLFLYDRNTGWLALFTVLRRW